MPIPNQPTRVNNYLKTHGARTTNELITTLDLKSTGSIHHAATKHRSIRKNTGSFSYSTDVNFPIIEKDFEGLKLSEVMHLLFQYITLCIETYLNTNEEKYKEAAGILTRRVISAAFVLADKMEGSTPRPAPGVVDEALKATADLIVESLRNSKPRTQKPEPVKFDYLRR